MTGAELKQWRELHSLTQDELASMLSTPLSSYRKWEQGQRRVPGIVPVALRCVERTTAARNMLEAAGVEIVTKPKQ